MKSENSLLSLTILSNILLLTGGHQGLPPGVNPQHYQHQQVPHMQQVPVQHMQQVPVQHMQQQHGVPMQQVPVQQQQMHMQQQPHAQQIHPPQMQMQQGQQHMPHGQPQPHMQQAHHGHHGQPQVLNVANIAQEKEHIAEHLSVPMDTSKMTEQELQFHYFKMHDADNNNKLDGCELIKSLIHWHEQGQVEQAGQPDVKEKLFSDAELLNLIDPILSLDDANSDGFIDYPEFVRAQQKASAPAQHK